MDVKDYLMDRKELIEGVIHTLHRDWKMDVDFRRTIEKLVHPYYHVKFDNGEENVFDLRRDWDLNLLTDYYDLCAGSFECRDISGKEAKIISARLNASTSV